MVTEKAKKGDAENMVTAYNKGYALGFFEGEEEGWEDGYNAGLDEVR